jgi:hypothetical protein
LSEGLGRIFCLAPEPCWAKARALEDWLCCSGAKRKESVMVR